MIELPLSVVVAEDDYLVAEHVCGLVREAGMKVVACVASGEAAAGAVVEHQPDVAILDLDMPGIGGLEAARRIRILQPTPIVVLSAYHSASLLEEATEAGVGAYLTKPSDRAELHRAVAVARARHGDLMRLVATNFELQQRTAELQEALALIESLRGVVPICMHCHRVRDDQGFWQRVEQFISRYTGARFSHGLCPECLHTHFPELDDGPSGE